MENNNIISNETIIEGRRTGKAPARGHEKMLNASNYLKATMAVPDEFNIWANRVPFPERTFGNISVGDCTRASQAILQMRSERLEQRRTINITDAEVLRVYYEMTGRLYGGGDTGAYELDALNEWRRPDYTFKDANGHPYTIDAFTRINQSNLLEVKQSLYVSQVHGIKFCMNLPLAFSNMPVQNWDIPEGQSLTGIWTPGSWGGHSMTATGYKRGGILWPTTWDTPDGFISWRAFAAYCDESYLVIDSINAWKKKRAISKLIDLTAIKNDVNAVSSYPIAA
jgi:hypothetical protein